MTIIKGKGISLRAKKRSKEDPALYLYLDIYKNGVRLCKSLGITIYSLKPKGKEKQLLEAAKRIFYKIQGEILENKYKPLIKKDYTFTEYLIRESAQRWKDKDKIRYKLKRVTEMWNEFAGNKKFEEINPKLVEFFKKFILVKFPNKNTASTYFQTFIQIINECTRYGYFEADPIPGIKRQIKRVESVRKYLTLHELKKLKDAYCWNKHCYNAFFFSVYTGLSKADLYSLVWSQIRQEGLDYFVYFKRKKTDKVRSIPISNHGLNYLTNRRGKGKEDEQVFKLPHYRNLRKCLRAWGINAEFSFSLTMHMARHTFATMALNAGVDIYTLKTWLGHSDIKTTEIYAKLANQKTILEAKKLPGI